MEPPFPPLSCCLLPRSSKCTLLLAASSLLCTTFVVYSGLLEQPAEDKTASMSFWVPERPTVVVHKKGDRPLPEAEDLSKIRRLTAEATRLHERLHESDAHCHHLRIQLCYIRETLDHYELELSARATEKNFMTSGRHRLPFNTGYERGTWLGRALDY